MPVLKKDVKNDFTVVHNAFIRDLNLGISSRGLLLTMISLPEGWNFSIKGLSGILIDGECKISSALKELEKYGYLVRKRICDGKGKVKDWEYIVSDEPLSEDIQKQGIYYKSQKSQVKNNESDDDSNTENSDEAIPDVDKPDLKNPHHENPDVGVSHLENPHDYKININQISNNQISNNQSIHQSNVSELSESSSDNVEIMLNDKDEIDRYRLILKSNIDYDWFICGYKDNDSFTLGSAEELNELLDIMLECVTSTSKTIRVAGHDMPKEAVKSRMLKLNSSHIEYIFNSLRSNNRKIANMKNYLITTLYNAPVTMANHITAQVNHDLYGSSG